MKIAITSLAAAALVASSAGAGHAGVSPFQLEPTLDAPSSKAMVNQPIVETAQLKRRRVDLRRRPNIRFRRHCKIVKTYRISNGRWKRVYVRKCTYLHPSS